MEYSEEQCTFDEVSPRNGGLFQARLCAPELAIACSLA